MMDISNEKNDPNTSISFLIDELLKKYNLNESIDVIRKKLTENIETNKAIIRHTAKNFAMEKIKEKDMHDFLLKDLNTTPNITKNIANDIKTTIAPFIKDVEASRPKDEIEPSDTSLKSFPPVTPKRMAIAKKTREVQTPEKKLQPDSYREPIE